MSHKPPLPLQAKGQGYFATMEEDFIYWTGQGVGKPTETGKVSFRGSINCQTKSQKLTRLNDVAILFEEEIDMVRKEYWLKFWEWK